LYNQLPLTVVSDLKFGILSH